MEIRPDRVHVARNPPDDEQDRRLVDEPRHVRGPVEFDPFKSFAFSLARFAILGSVIAAILAAGGIAIWVIRGAAPVREAAREFATAEDIWFSSLSQAPPIIRELTVLGAPRDELETVYLAYFDAKKSYRAENADVLLQVMQDQVVAVRGLGHDVKRVLGMLQPVMRSRVQVSDAYLSWVKKAEQPSARVAILLGMASRPPDRLVQYEEMPRMIQTVSGGAPP
ncbi:MAG: hypothetical protein AAF602_18815 [Myxococcota bacterium]